MKKIFFFLLFNVFTSSIFAQNTNANPCVSDTLPILEEPFYPLLSAVVIAPKAISFAVFNSALSRNLTTSYQVGTDIIEEHIRQQALFQFVQVNYGFSKNPRVNIGVDIAFTHTRGSANLEDSFWKILQKSDPNTGQPFHGARSIGLRLRALPFRTIPELSVQTAISFPVAKDAFRQQLAGQDRMEWQGQMVFYQHLLPNLTWQIQTDIGWAFKNEKHKQNTLSGGVNSYWIYQIWRGKGYLLGNIRYGARNEKSILGGYPRKNYEWMAGFGAFYQVSKFPLGVSVQYSRPIAYDIGSIITEVDAGTWWNLDVGVQCVFGFK